MKPATRRSVFLVAGGGLFAALIWGFAGLPDFGDFHGAYGQFLNRASTPQRATTDVITAVNFDYRGFDTLGEEFILFAAVSTDLIPMDESGSSTSTAVAIATGAMVAEGPVKWSCSNGPLEASSPRELMSTEATPSPSSTARAGGPSTG